MSRPNFVPSDINIVCSDLKRSLDFYTNVLGFELTEKTDTYCHLKLGKRVYTLLAFAIDEAVVPYGSNAAFSMDIIVEDIDKANEWFLLQEVRYAKALEKGADHFFIYDPDGLVWEVIEWSVKQRA